MKAGTITASAVVALSTAIIPTPAPFQAKLGDLALSILKNSVCPSPALLVIDTAQRKLAVYEDNAGALNSLNSLSPKYVKTVLTPEATDVSSATYTLSEAGGDAGFDVTPLDGMLTTATGIVAKLRDLVQPTAPSFSGGSLINAICDAADAEPSSHGFIVISQVRKNVAFYRDEDVTDVTTISPIVSLGAAPIVIFTQATPAEDSAVVTPKSMFDV